MLPGHLGKSNGVAAKVHDVLLAAFDGFSKQRVHSGQIENLSDEDLKRLNNILPWMCFTADNRGRRFGNSAWIGKRDRPQVLPDPRVVYMDEVFGLKGKSVLEVGCFEGIHTIALMQCGAEVVAVDSRIENIVKTIVRCNLFGYKPTCQVCDVESSEDLLRLPPTDLVHHVGVLYHLKDPITHIKKLAGITGQGFLLDTHYASYEMANMSYQVGGRQYRYYHYREKGRDEVFSGMYDHAKWLLIDDLKAVLTECGFSKFQIIKDAPQRNGPRVTALAFR